MKKNMFMLAAAALMTAATLTSCATINSGASISNTTLGTKVGEAKSKIVLGLWSKNGKNNDIARAAKNGGITTIHQVEYVNEVFFGGFLIKHTTRVYGE